MEILERGKKYGREPKDLVGKTSRMERVDGYGLFSPKWFVKVEVLGQVVGGRKVEVHTTSCVD